MAKTNFVTSKHRIMTLEILILKSHHMKNIKMYENMPSFALEMLTVIFPRV